MSASNKNKTCKLISSLAKKKYRISSGLFLVEGVRFVSEIPESVHIEFYACASEFNESRSNFAFRNNVRKYVFSKEIFDTLTDTVSPQGILAVCRQIKNDYEGIFVGNQPKTVVVIEGLRDPGNLGTLIRTADAAGVSAIFLIENTVDLYNPKVLRSTMGSVFNIPIFYDISTNELFEALRTNKFQIFGTSLNADKMYYDAEFMNNAAIVVGSEADGISKKILELCDELIKIPIEGKAESLNAAIAGSIVIYEALRRKKTRK